MTYTPKCLMTWASQQAGADDQMTSRTAEQVMAELNQSLETLSEIERMTPPISELAQMRRANAEWLAHRAILEVQAIQDMRAALDRARVAP